MRASVRRGRLAVPLIVAALVAATWLTAPPAHAAAPAEGTLDAFDVVGSGSTGRIRVRGWARQPGVPGPTTVHVYAGATLLGAVRADQPRPDVGGNVGFDGLLDGTAVARLPDGNVRLRLHAIGRNPDGSPSRQNPVLVDGTRGRLVHCIGDVRCGPSRDSGWGLGPLEEGGTYERCAVRAANGALSQVEVTTGPNGQQTILQPGGVALASFAAATDPGARITCYESPWGVQRFPLRIREKAQGATAFGPARPFPADRQVIYADGVAYAAQLRFRAARTAAFGGVYDLNDDLLPGIILGPPSAPGADGFPAVSAGSSGTVTLNSLQFPVLDFG